MTTHFTQLHSSLLKVGQISTNIIRDKNTKAMLALVKLYLQDMDTLRIPATVGTNAKTGYKIKHKTEA